MSLGKFTKTRYPGVYRRKDGRLVVRTTARAAGERVQQIELQREGITLEQARHRAEVLRDRVKEDVERLKEGQGRPAASKHQAASMATETFFDYTIRWLNQKGERTKPGTRHRYSGALVDHILPRLGKIRVVDMNRTLVEGWVAWAERKRMKDGQPYSKGALTGWWRLLGQILKDMAADFNLPDPTNRVRPPQSDKPLVREQGVLSAEQLGAFLTGVETYSPNRYAEILTVALTGMRPGEVYALKWDCIDLEAEAITVRRGISGGKLSPTTKTKSPRVVPIHPMLVDVLREHRKSMMAGENSRLKENWAFPTDDGEMRLPQSAARVYDLAREAAKIEQRVGPQVLRRSMNTALLRAGVDRITLRAMMGHCSEQMTERYAGIALDLKKTAIQMVFPHEKKPTG